MSEKTQISITVDPEVAEYLSQDGINRSGFLNKAAREKIGLDARNTEMLQLRLQQVRDEREEAEDKAERKRQIEEQLQSKLEEKQQQQEQEQEQLWKEAESVIDVEEIGGTEIITTKDRYLKEWADRLNISVDELKAEILARRED
jgi:hypothetical protein